MTTRSIQPDRRHARCDLWAPVWGTGRRLASATRVPFPETTKAPQGAGLSFMRRRGLEPPRGNPPTRPSTLRVYQFRHRRVTGANEHSERGRIATVTLIPSEGLATFTNTCSTETRLAKGDPGGSDQAPAGNLRLHQAVLGQARVPADGARHRQGRGARIVLDGACAPGQPREARAASP